MLHHHKDDPAGPPGCHAPVTSITEITVVGGERYRVERSAREVEKLILDAARGSLMELAWLTEAESGEQLGVNPEHVVMLRTITT
jgi:hypothetical protein